MKPRLAWLQILIGWLSAWALFVALIFSVHAGMTVASAAILALRSILAAAVVSIPVRRLTARVPWPHPLRLSFVVIHLLAAAAYAVAWVLANSAIESLVRLHLILVVGIGLGPSLVSGVWLYVMIVGILYATAGTERAARAEALALESQLAALRSQLNPHFLFNALHTVVHLIPREPRRAARAAEQVATLLRAAIEEDRDVVSLGEEWAFVERYLEIERIRFGDRLVVRAAIPDDALGALVPSFAVQTLVENAVRHGAAPAEMPTEITVVARSANDTLEVTVADTGMGASAEQMNGQNGTGLRRLRERLAALYGAGARLDLSAGRPHGVIATLVIPLEAAE